jgi:hypothetical protein
MESTPLSTANDPENDFDTKKFKDRRVRLVGLESTPEHEDNVISLRQSRHIAREALRHDDSEAPEPFFAKAERAEEEHEAEEVVLHSHDKITDRINEIDNDREQAHEHRQRAPEARQLHGEVEAPGHIGHVLVAAEAPERSRGASPHERVQIPANKRIETLSRSELLSLSEGIAVEGSTLRNVYETHLIGEQALRRLVAEYFHGGDIQKALLREIVEHEIDFERDPALRDKSVPGAVDDDDARRVSVPGRGELDHLLEKAGAGIVANDELVAYDKTDAKHEGRQAVQRYPQQRPLDVMMAVTILVLIIVVVALYFWHH